MQRIELNKRAEDKNVPLDGFVDWKRIGNEHFTCKRYKDAIYAYSEGLKKDRNSIELIANRSAAFLGLCKYKCALHDSECVLAIDKYHTKCIVRKVKALFGMALYRDAMSYLETISQGSIPQKHTEVITDLKAKGKMFIAQSEDGDYPWSYLYKTKNVYHDMADYTRSVIVEEAPTKGRGLFATKAIKAGELILASKAFAYVFDQTPSEAIYSLNYMDASVSEIHVQLIEKIIQILVEDPEKYEAVGALYAGPELSYLKCVEGNLSEDFHVDMKRIEHISVYNTFSNRELLNGSFMRSSGLWITPSFLNHSCADANSTWLVIGDFVFVRAFKDISVGEEITIAYKAPTELIAQNELEMYDFICSCRVCERDKRDNETMKDYRATLHSTLQLLLEKMKKCCLQKQYDDDFQHLLKLFEQSRNDAPELNLCLVDSLVQFAEIRFNNGKFAESAAAYEDLYNLTKNVAAFQPVATFLACVKIIVSYLLGNETSKAISWIEILKKETRLSYGTLDYIDVMFPEYIEIMRRRDLDI